MLLLYIFVAVVLVNCGYYLFFLRFASEADENLNSKQSVPVSLIVCAKNEAENLLRNIPHWISQESVDFQLILVNDASVDDSLSIMQSFADEYPNIEIVDVENNEAFWASKKYALTLGIKRAKYNHLVLTDADCRPGSSKWLYQMAAKFSGQKKLVLGYSGYFPKKGLLNAMVRYETAITAIQYLGYAANGLPYMGVGRNLAYTSDLFYAQNGFMSHMNLPSGDDDLFVNEVATRENCTYSVTSESFTYSEAKATWKDWFYQKKRHSITATHYKPKFKFLLGLYYVVNLAFWVLLPLCFIMYNWEIPTVALMVRIGLQYLVIGKGLRRLKEKSLIPAIPLFELVLVCLQLSIFISNTFAKPRKWK